MASLVQPGKYDVINTSDTTGNGIYAIKLFSNAYMLQKIQQLMDKLFLRLN